MSIRDIASEVESTLQYGKEVVAATARGAVDALPEKGSRLDIDQKTVWVGAGVGAAVGVCCAAITQKRKSPLALLAGGLMGGALAAGLVIAWQNRGLAEQVVRGGIEGSRPLRDARWLANHPIDYA